MLKCNINFNEKMHLENLEEVRAEEARKRAGRINYEKMERQRQKALKLKEKIDAEEKGEDLERLKMRKYTIEEIEKWNDKEKLRENQKDPGFSDYRQMTIRKYEKLTSNIKPDLETYEKQKAVNGINEYFETTNSLAYDAMSAEISSASVDRMVSDLNKQLEKREKFSKRKRHDAEKEVTYINSRNETFNKKIARNYDMYTKEIRENFERGTAL
ncbi:SYF2-domain-containing protein [Rozella allomycis CSF55]|uniref:Pre-mRNA-splicing factor SYF2 n=1 Tax=Rozella allomycis (strain CSF55) TaxID=988480 RepID=A0A4P9YKH3_ROZAC|nr:SYF2-domain-containing protein [Rozella allomycis CSF55]